MSQVAPYDFPTRKTIDATAPRQSATLSPRMIDLLVVLAGCAIMAAAGAGIAAYLMLPFGGVG